MLPTKHVGPALTHLSRELREQVLQVERQRRHLDLPVRPRPDRRVPVPVDLDAVAVGVVQVDAPRSRGGRRLPRAASPLRAAAPAPRPGDGASVRGSRSGTGPWCRAAAGEPPLLCHVFEPEMVVIVAGGEEHRLGAVPGAHAEADHVDVEALGPLEVGRPSGGRGRCRCADRGHLRSCGFFELRQVARRRVATPRPPRSPRGARSRMSPGSAAWPASARAARRARPASGWRCACAPRPRSRPCAMPPASSGNHGMKPRPSCSHFFSTSSESRAVRL